MMYLFRKFVRWFLQQLYGPFAWLYDIVAKIVSLGQWNEWSFKIQKFLKHDEKTLEIGFGTGSLHRFLLNENYQIFGCDLSKQMVQISSKRLKDCTPKILRANIKNLPFRADSFSKIIATFPSEYIFSDVFLKESQRLLVFGGELIVLLSVNFVKNDVLSQIYRILYKITGQSLSKTDSEKVIRDLFGYCMEVNIVWEPYKNVELCFVLLKSK